jgi:hypothetical protein
MAFTVRSRPCTKKSTKARKSGQDKVFHRTGHGITPRREQEAPVEDMNEVSIETLDLPMDLSMLQKELDEVYIIIGSRSPGS